MSKSDRNKIENFEYPQSRKVDQVDDYHGTLVNDPYRWLEDSSSAEVADWVTEQNKFTDQFFATKYRGGDKLYKEISDFHTYETKSLFGFVQGRYYFFHNTGLDLQSKICVSGSLSSNEMQVLVNPLDIASDGSVSLSRYAVISRDGRFLLYALVYSGSDWQEWNVMDLQTGKNIEAPLKDIKFDAISWAYNSKGLYYSGYTQDSNDESELKSAVFYHRLGEDQAQDKQVFAVPDSNKRYYSCMEVLNGKYILVTVYNNPGGGHRLFLRAKSSRNSQGNQFVELTTDDFSDFEYIGCRKKSNSLFFVTNHNAENSRLVKICISKSESEDLSSGGVEEVLPEGADVIGQVLMLRDNFVIRYTHNVSSQIKVYSRSCKLKQTLNLPAHCTADILGSGQSKKVVHLSISSFSQPRSLYSACLKTGKLQKLFAPKLKTGLDNVSVKQVFYPSKDGTQIPMFVICRKDISLDGQRPTFLYGYGGFNVSILPGYSSTYMTWIARGGVVAVVNLRGGSEFGESWHRAGMRENKQNVFDDFIHAALWLIDNKFTNSKKLNICGYSNGGLLVGACLTQRPDLFASAVPHVGVLDMLRFHRFTVGWGWIDDYGNPDKAEDFQYIYKYSPLHQVKDKVSYPPTLVMTGDSDNRVVPAHSYKFTATLQAVNGNKSPALLRVTKNAGHGAGRSREAWLREEAEVLAFMLNSCAEQV